MTGWLIEIGRNWAELSTRKFHSLPSSSWQMWVRICLVQNKKINVDFGRVQKSSLYWRLISFEKKGFWRVLNYSWTSVCVFFVSKEMWLIHLEVSVPQIDFDNLSLAFLIIFAVCMDFKCFLSCPTYYNITCFCLFPFSNYGSMERS